MKQNSLFMLFVVCIFVFTACGENQNYILIPDGDLDFETETQEVEAKEETGIKTKSLTKIWEKNLEDNNSFFEVGNDGLYVIEENCLVGLDFQTGEQFWQFCYEESASIADIGFTKEGVFLSLKEASNRKIVFIGENEVEVVIFERDDYETFYFLNENFAYSSKTLYDLRSEVEYEFDQILVKPQMVDGTVFYRDVEDCVHGFDLLTETSWSRCWQNGRVRDYSVNQNGVYVLFFQPETLEQGLGKRIEMLDFQTGDTLHQLSFDVEESWLGSISSLKVDPSGLEEGVFLSDSHTIWVVYPPFDQIGWLLDFRNNSPGRFILESQENRIFLSGVNSGNSFLFAVNIDAAKEDDEENFIFWAHQIDGVLQKFAKRGNLFFTVTSDAVLSVLEK